MSSYGRGWWDDIPREFMVSVWPPPVATNVAQLQALLSRLPPELPLVFPLALQVYASNEPTLTSLGFEDALLKGDPNASAAASG